MKIEFRASSPADAEELAAFCRRVLSVPGHSPMFDDPLLQWKYWQPWCSWSGSRSYVLTRGGRLVAHCAVMPLVLQRAERERTLLYPFDWAAEPSVVGSGAALLEQMTRLADGVVIVGGSQMTQRLAVPLGYRPAPPVTRFALGLAGAQSESRSEPSELEARRLDTITSIPDRDVGSSDGSLCVQHPLAVLNEWLRCPVARVQCYQVSRGGRNMGVILLAFTPGQARLVELWPSAADGKVVVSLLQAARGVAEQDPGGAAELVAMANTPLEEKGLLVSGFRACGRVPMWTSFGEGSLPGRRRIRFQLLQGDMAFLHHGVPEMWSEPTR